MFRQLFNIASNTFLEAIRQPVYFVVLTAGWLLQILNIALSGYNMGLTDNAEVTKDDKMLLDVGLATVFVACTLLAAMICTSVVSREIENKTALTVISKPIGRPVFIIGKYLGATAAVLLAGGILSIFFLLALRNGVLSTARDHVDLVVLLFGLGAVGLSVFIGAWGNFFYGWVFSSTTVFLMAPLTLLAWVGTLVLSSEWAVQSIGTDWNPNIMLTVACVLLAMPVLSAVALAASTRLGQVMTIVVCAGVFLGGMLSNYVFGRRAIVNESLVRIESVEATDDSDSDFSDPGDAWTLTLETSPSEALSVGELIHYGSAPSGLDLVTTGQTPFDGDARDGNELIDTAARAIVVRNLTGDRLDTLEIVNAGGYRPGRPPQDGDYIFTRETEFNAVSMGAWGVVPNMQFFWLVDAVTQAHPIPPRYVAMTAFYALSQIVALNGLAIFLFQRREVG